MNKNKLLYSTIRLIVIAFTLILLSYGCSSHPIGSLNTPKEKFEYIHSSIENTNTKLAALIDSNYEAKTRLELYHFNQRKNHLPMFTEQLESIRKGYKPEYFGFKPWIKYKLYGYLPIKDFKKEQWKFFYDIKKFNGLLAVQNLETSYSLHTFNSEVFKNDFNSCLEFTLQDIGGVHLISKNRAPFYSDHPGYGIERELYEVYKKSIVESEKMAIRLTKLQFKEKQ